MWTRDLIAASARSAYDHHGEAWPEGIAHTAEAAAEPLAADLGIDSDPGSVLAHLVDGSMIEARFDGGTRYRAPETLRAFGLDRLAAASEDEAAARRMFGWAVELTAEIEAALTTEREPEADATLRRELAPTMRASCR